MADARRLPLAAVAASAWGAQTYPERELVVVNATGRALPGGLPEGAVEVRAEPGTPGRLRNLGCDAATGEWLAQWDDDDWSAPDRLTVQMAQRREGACCLLRRQARYDVTPDSRRGGLVDAPAGAGGTLLWPAGAARFPETGAWEDLLFVERNFPPSRRVVADAPGPWLSCAFWHGLNATPRPDFLAGAVALGTDCVARLGDVLRRYGMSLDGRRLAG